VTFTGQQTQTQLWKGMADVLGQRYAKDPNKAIKEWLSVLDAFDTIDARKRQLQEQLDEVRATDGPQSSRARKLTEGLAKTADRTRCHAGARGQGQGPRLAADAAHGRRADEVGPDPAVARRSWDPGGL
jgi:hypothetical protein